MTLSWDTGEGDAGTHDLVVASDTANATVTTHVTPASEEGPPPVVGDEPPQDLTGDGRVSVGDVQGLFMEYLETS